MESLSSHLDGRRFASLLYVDRFFHGNWGEASVTLKFGQFADSTVVFQASSCQPQEATQWSKSSLTLKTANSPHLSLLGTLTHLVIHAVIQSAAHAPAA